MNILLKNLYQKQQSEKHNQNHFNNDIQKDYELPDCEPCVNIPILEEPSIPNETIHENIETIHENVETIHENVETIPENTGTIHDNTGTIEQEKTIVDEQAPAPAAIVNNIQLDDNASLIGTDSPRQRLPKKRRSIINEFDTISVETLTHTLRNIQLRVLKIDDCLIGDVQRNHNTLVNLKRYPGYTWQEERFTQVSLNVGHFFSNNVMIPRAITTDHQRRQETQQDIHQDVSNFIANKPVEDNITSQIDEQSVDQVFPNEALPNQQESNLNILPEPTIDLLPTQDIANTNVQILDTQLVTPAQDNSEQQVADNNYDNQHDLNVNGNVDLSMYEDRVINPSPESLNYVITKTDVEERLNMCREKNLFPLSFYDLFPSDVDSKNDAVLGFYHLLDIAGENGNEWNLYQSEQLLIEYCSKDFSFSYK
ncbi:hypothetical protein HCN44_001049 [Aphidius gifuensis]|uniref:Uncharacterized protein n=1 Tax=Aphidius gifuensis TaxID=684658 RepID=A0A834XM13_APHGI|nr:hypothetical protein HCN44_001049 [Aphidius gifuensis]